MTTRIDTPPGHSPQTAFHAGEASVQMGRFRGEQVLVKDVSSILADAAEEISLHTSERVESKRHCERKVGADGRVDRLRIEQIEAYLKAAHALDDPQRMAQNVKQMLQSTGQDPRDWARHQAEEPAQQFMLLQYALYAGEAQGVSAEVLERVQDALADIEAEQGPRIRAGINTIDAVAAAGKTASGLRVVQQTYADVVLGAATLSETLLMVLERLSGPSGENFKSGLQTLIHAVGADMSAARPSLDKERLSALWQDLYKLEVIATVLEGCEELADTLRSPPHNVGTLKPVALMKDLVMVTGERWVTSARFNGWADQRDIGDVSTRIAFFSKVKNLLALMPVKVFAEESRAPLLDAAQHALDAVIDLEDE